MTRNDRQNSGPLNDVGTIVAGIEAHQLEPLPSDLEAAWNEWARRLRQSLNVRVIDERELSLIRAGFQAGYRAHHDKEK